MHILQTARLSLRPWQPDLEADLFRLSSDERVMRFIGDGRTWSRERTAERHEACVRHWRSYGFGWRAIFDDGAFVGVAALNRLGGRVPGIDESAVEIGWWIDPGAWGRGFATEAAVALRDEAFVGIGTEILAARYHPANAASGRIMIKLGMHLWGERADKDGRPVRVYVLDRTSWEDARRTAPKVRDENGTSIGPNDWDVRGAQ